jgi:hypothetical protein
MRNFMGIEVYCDNETEGLWFSGLHTSFLRVPRRKLGRRGANPACVDALLAYDRPDIIVVVNGKPSLVVEKTREVPTGHNVGQRMARIVRAAELGVPVVAFFPFDARKHGRFSGVCNLNVRILEAFELMWQIHKSPVVAVNWPADAHGTLIGDGSEDFSMRQLIRALVEGDFVSPWPLAEQFRLQNRSERARRVQIRSAYERSPKSVTTCATAEFIASEGSRLSEHSKALLARRLETVVYTIGMLEESCRREDPYTGMQFIYDYTYCRSGPKVDQKSRNLVLSFPRISLETWCSSNPNDLNRKSCNWYLTANLLVFKDGSIPLR